MVQPTTTPTKQPDIIPYQTGAIHPDFARHILDAEPLRFAFYSVFAGWRRQLEDVTFTSALGRTGTRQIEQIHRETDRRLCNDAGSDYLYMSYYPLVSPMAGSSKNTEKQLYATWRTRLYETPWTLAKKIVNQGNPFQMKLSSLPEINANLAQLYIIGQRSDKGWSMDTIASKFAGNLWAPGDAYMGQAPPQVQPRSKTWKERLLGG